MRSRASWSSPTIASAETSQNEQIRKVPSLPENPVVGLVGAVAEHESVLGQVGSDRVDGGAQSVVVGRKEAEDRGEQHRGIERVGLVVLAQHALVGRPMGEDVGADLLSGLAPLLRERASPRISARLAARSSATQHMSFDDT